MWAEARKHEKKLRGLMIDYRRRAERRREFYDRIRSDPAAFLQIHGNQMKIHIDPNVCSAAESSLMPWMGDTTNLIDRFDVRAHLDRLDIANTSIESAITSGSDETLERQINYERYRNLVQNEFLNLNESKFLQQIWFEERFGVNHNQKDIQNKANQKKKLAEKKATIAYNYDNDDTNSQTIQTKNSESSSEESSDEDYDFDTTVNIDHLDNESGHRINGIALKYGMKNDDFVKYLDEDKTEAEKIRVQKEIENEKSMFTGRKSRRERRALKEQRLMILRAANVEESEKNMNKKIELEKQSQSSSDSEISVDENKIEFITSFGGSSEEDKPQEEIQKKQKQVIAKRKQKTNQKIETIPIVYGPTLPGDEKVSSVMTTTFNKSSHSKQRTYRFNDLHKRSRSRSDSSDRFKYRKTVGRHFSRRSSRSRSTERRHSSNRMPDRYRERRRSRERNRYKDLSRSRSHSRSRDRRRSRSRNRNKRSRSRTPRRRRSRSSSRTKRKSRKSRDRSHSRRRSRSRRSRSRVKDRCHRDAYKTSPKRSRSKSQNKKVIQNFENKNLAQKSEKIMFTSDPINDSKPEFVSTKEENEVKAPSPPVKSYYRHDLCESEESDEEMPSNEGNQTEKEGSKKRSSNVLNLSSGYKSSVPSTTNTLQEKLKKKRQALIDKQYKLDKKAELQKLEKQQQEREDREEELREMTSKLRYRREFYRNDRRSSRSSSHSRSVSRCSSSSSSY